jgi:hypothetical protein
VTSPQENLERLASEARQAATDAYWKKHSLPTATVLVLCLVGSHFVAPLEVVQAVLFVLSGVLTDRGGALYRKGQFGLSTIVQTSGLLLGGYLFFNTDNGIFGLYVQAFGLFFLGFYGYGAAQQLLAHFRELSRK